MELNLLYAILIQSAMLFFILIVMFVYSEKNRKLLTVLITKYADLIEENERLKKFIKVGDNERIKK